MSNKALLIQARNEIQKLWILGDAAAIIANSAIVALTAAIDASEPETIPLEGSQPATDAINAMLKEYGYPCNPANAARVGYRAARLMSNPAPLKPLSIKQRADIVDAVRPLQFFDDFLGDIGKVIDLVEAELGVKP